MQGHQEENAHRINKRTLSHTAPLLPVCAPFDTHLFKILDHPASCSKGLHSCTYTTVTHQEQPLSLLQDSKRAAENQSIMGAPQLSTGVLEQALAVENFTGCPITVQVLGACLLVVAAVRVERTEKPREQQIDLRVAGTKTLQRAQSGMHEAQRVSWVLQQQGGCA